MTEEKVGRSPCRRSRGAAGGREGAARRAFEDAEVRLRGTLPVGARLPWLQERVELLCCDLFPKERVPEQGLRPVQVRVPDIPGKVRQEQVRVRVWRPERARALVQALSGHIGRELAQGPLCPRLRCCRTRRTRRLVLRYR